MVPQRIDDHDNRPEDRKSAQSPDGSRRAERDFVALGIAVAAILMFVSTGLKVLPTALSSLLSEGIAPDPMLTNALILNVALLIFGWRRYSDLKREVAQRRDAEEHARILAETDALTGCLNRRSLVPSAAAMMRSHGGAITVMLLDLDNFKQINDANGHRVGDDVLTGCVARIRNVIPDSALLARLGGDEFAIVLPYSADMTSTSLKVAEEVIDAVRNPAEIDGLTVRTSVSMGLAATAEDIDTSDAERAVDQLLHRADIAMYQAKKQGKDRASWFEPAMETELKFRRTIEEGIRKALQNGEFIPYYQQQNDIVSGRITGFEMLARWTSEELGVVSPDIFIPIAEEMGLIGALSEHLLAQALDDAKQWDQDISLSVNISPVQLRDPWFSQKLLRLLTEKNFPAGRLDIEITESCLHENMPAVQAMVSSLRNQGVKISLDDFGTGYASLAQLRSLPFDRIKIDKSFVSSLQDTEADMKLVGAIVSLGQSLNLPITAEGIESEGVLSVLQKMGEIKGQGFLYGEPANAEETLKLLAAQADGTEAAAKVPSETRKAG